MALFFKKRTRGVAPSRHAAVPVGAARRSRRSRPPGIAVPAYVLLVDQSGSTGCAFRVALGKTISRIEAIQWAADAYFAQLAASNHRQLVALVGFSDQAHLYHPLSPVGHAAQSVRRAVWSLHPQSLTNLSAGLELALGQLDRVGATRGNIVLVSDGAANVQTERLPSLIQRARASRVRIFTIGVGNHGDSDYDRSLLVRMARNTGGRFMSAHSFKALCGALRRAC